MRLTGKKSISARPMGDDEGGLRKFCVPAYATTYDRITLAASQSEHIMETISERRAP